MAEIQFSDYIYNTIDLLKSAGLQSWQTNGDFCLPMTIMTITGSGIRGSIYHSHSLDSTATHLAGWKIVFPSNPVDAYGLMLSCLKENNPTLFMMPKALLRMKADEPIPGIESDVSNESIKALSKDLDMPVTGDNSKWKPKWPKLIDYSVPIGHAKITRAGDHITLVTYGRHVPMAGQAADQLREEGISVEVIDMRTLFPYDWETIRNSIAKTKRVVFLNEELEITNFGEHLIRRTVEELFYDLEARPKLLAGAHIPGIGLADALEMASVPQLGHILECVREVVRERA